MKRHGYDQTENALFSIVRIASAVGWLATGGEPMPQKIFIIVYRVDIPKDGIDISLTTE